MKYNHTLTGITLIKNGNQLGYPYIQCIKSLATLCDQVLINAHFEPGCCSGCPEVCSIHNVDPDGTIADLQNSGPFPKKNITILMGSWNMRNTGNGEELAKQANELLPMVTSDWVLYLQADELIHEQDFIKLRQYLDTIDESISQIELFRTYFWKNLETRAPDFEIWLGRLFRKGTHRVGGDGMYLIRESGHVARSPFWIYHYSRIGPEDKVAARVRNLDTLFHNADNLPPLFSYNNNNVKLIPYSGSHPAGIEEFYKDK